MSITWIRAFKALAEATRLAGYKPGMLTTHHPLYGHYVEYVTNMAKSGKLTDDQRAELANINFPVPAAEVKQKHVHTEVNGPLLMELARVLRRDTSLTPRNVEKHYPDLWRAYQHADQNLATLDNGMLGFVLQITDTLYDREDAPAHTPAK